MFRANVYLKGIAMLQRKILTQLAEWKARSDRKPLVLRGARQVGKTTAVDMFSKEFDNYIYLNLERAGDRNVFGDKMDVKELFQAVLILKDMTLKPGNTLIFIDEIQNSPTAVKLLRFFYEEMQEVFVIGAGSLLEIMLEKENISFPVGRVEYLYMYPMTFEESLTAKGGGPALDAFCQVPVKKYAHAKLLALFHEYVLIGGMPEVVKAFIDSNNVKELDSVYEALLVSYVNDAEKYARNHTLRQVLRHAIESLPFESGRRIKFQGFGNSNYKSREVGEALRTIERAMLIYLIFPSTVTDIPIRIDYKKSPLLQFLDTGLLNYYMGLQHDFFKFRDLHSFYRGLIAEHIVRQELMAVDATKNRKHPFWVRAKKQSNAEVDILLQHKNYIIPVEVKAGKTGMLRSLHAFMNRASHAYAVRLYAGELEVSKVATTQGKQYQLLNLPYYLAGRLHEYVEWFVDKSGG